jgi:hypothetical protein
MRELNHERREMNLKKQGNEAYRTTKRKKDWLWAGCGVTSKRSTSRP